MTREATNSQACASCKHQRKKCNENCELAPYFPASKYAEFQNAHRLFGVSNIQRLLALVEPHQRQEAADSILMEGKNRSNDPVHGCLGIISDLNSQIELCQKELETVNQYLCFLRHKEKIEQRQNQILDEFLDAFSPSLDLPSEHMCDVKNEEHGYNYLSTLEVAEDVKPFDIQSFNSMIESYQKENVVHPMK